MRLRGELDLASAPTLAGRLGELRDRREPVLLDIDGLDFIDMSGLRVLLAAADDGAQDGWVFAITRGSAPVRRLIELAHVDGQLPRDGSSA